MTNNYTYIYSANNSRYKNLTKSKEKQTKIKQCHRFGCTYQYHTWDKSPNSL